MNRMLEDLVEATVVQALPNAMFRVRMTDGREVSASVTGSMRVQFIRLVAGDRVLVQPSPFDPTKTRIVQPFKAGDSGGERSQPPKELPE